MKNLTLLLLLMMSSLLLEAQDLAVRKIHFGITVNPQMNMTSFGRAMFVEKENSFCFGSSADVYVDLSSRSQLKTGLGIQYLTLRHRDRSARWPIQVVNGEYRPDLVDAYFGYNTDYFFASLPVSLKTKFSDNPDHLYVTGGVNLQALLTDGGEIVINEGDGVERSTPIDGFLFKSESLMLNVALGAGFEKVVGKTKMFLEPNFQYSVGQFFDEKAASARANGHILLLGLKLGFYI